MVCLPQWKTCRSALVCIALFLQGCAADPEVLSTGASFDQSDSYGLVVFGVNLSHRRGSHGGGAVAFGKIDLPTESLEVSCLSGATILSVLGPRKRSNTMRYIAFRAPPGVYVTFPTLHASHSTLLLESDAWPEDRDVNSGLASFEVVAGKAFYVGDLIFFGWGDAKASSGFEGAQKWALHNLNLSVPLEATSFKPHHGKFYQPTCAL